MTGFSHTTVLPEETLQFLAPRAGGVYCDATLGGAGHAVRILEASAPSGRLIGVDRDPVALAAARERLAPFGERATLVHGRFGEMPIRSSPTSAWRKSHGIVVDLGVSSPQLDVAERGFSFGKEGPLDMRMDRSLEGNDETAADLLARVTVEELERILRDYGEERYAGRVARSIKDALRAGSVTTTTELAKIVRAAMPPNWARHEKIDAATRTFQALRIAVNHELDELESFLGTFPDLLVPGGRCVVIAFHSLEDRPVKERFRDLEWTSRLPADLAAAAGEPTVPVCRALTKKPVVAGDEELAKNPRARSAKLRACVKV